MHPFRRHLLWAAERRGIAWIDVPQVVEAALRADDPACERLRDEAVPSALPPVPDEYEPHWPPVFTPEARSYFERAAGEVDEETLARPPAREMLYALLAEACRFDLGREALAAVGLEPDDVRRVIEAL